MTLVALGIALSFIAMLSWGFGDFLIQKSTRKVGDWETLFVMTLFGAVVLLPFVWHSLVAVFTDDSSTLIVLIITSLILFVAALIDFEALKQGKLAIVEPMWSLEVPVAAVLAYFIVSERITSLQFVLIVLLVICLMLVAYREKKLNKSILMEKGIAIAILGGVLMGAANFFMGYSARLTDPLLVNFFTDAAIMVLCGLYLLAKGRLGRVFVDLKHGYGVLLPMSIADKVAWVSYVFAMTLAPIAVATALSESYIIIAVLLGLYFNHERPYTHQKVGLIGAVAAAVVLASITAGV